MATDRSKGPCPPAPGGGAPLVGAFASGGVDALTTTREVGRLVAASILDLVNGRLDARVACGIARGVSTLHRNRRLEIANGGGPVRLVYPENGRAAEAAELRRRADELEGPAGRDD